MTSLWYKLPDVTDSDMKKIFIGDNITLKRHKQHWDVIHQNKNRTKSVLQFWWGEDHEHETNEQAFAAAQREANRLMQAGFGRVL